MTLKKNKDKEITEKDIEQSKFSETDIQENFPALYSELTGEATASLSSDETKKVLFNHLEDEDFDSENKKNSEINLETDIEEEIKNKSMEKDYLRGFNPQAIDFIRRAKNNTEAVDVLNYLEKRGEISSDESMRLKNQLETQGLDSFGEHKQDGFYFEYQRKRHMEEKMKLTGKQPVK